MSHASAVATHCGAYINECQPHRVAVLPHSFILVLIGIPTLTLSPSLSLSLSLSLAFSVSLSAITMSGDTIPTLSAASTTVEAYTACATYAQLYADRLVRPVARLLIKSLWTRAGLRTSCVRTTAC